MHVSVLYYGLLFYCTIVSYFCSLQSILVTKKLGLEGSNVKVPGFKGCTLSKLDSDVTPAQLARYRRQFLNYTKLNPPSASQHTPEHLSQLFVQFLNTMLAGVT